MECHILCHVPVCSWLYYSLSSTNRSPVYLIRSVNFVLAIEIVIKEATSDPVTSWECTCLCVFIPKGSFCLILVDTFSVLDARVYQTLSNFKLILLLATTTDFRNYTHFYSSSKNSLAQLLRLTCHHLRTGLTYSSFSFSKRITDFSGLPHTT